MQKGLAPIVVVLILAGAIVLTGGVYYLGKVTSYNQDREVKENPVTTAAPSITSSLTPTLVLDETLGWKTEQEIDYKYSFKYPQNVWISSGTVELGPVDGLYSVKHGDGPPAPEGTVAIMSVENWTNREDKNFSSWATKFLQRKEVKIVSKNDILVNNSSALLVDGLLGNIGTFHLLLKRDDLHYVAINIASSKLSKTDLRLIFEKITATVRYL